MHDPAQGGGRILGEGCHFIDFVTWLVGALPVKVTARALPDNGRYRGDNVLIQLAYPDGSIGTVSYMANGDKSFSKERVEVTTGGRAAVLDDFRLLETYCRRQPQGGKVPPAPGQGSRRGMGCLRRRHPGGRSPADPLRALDRGDVRHL